MFFAIGHSIRLARAGFLLAREGVFADVDPAALPPPARVPIFLARLVNRRGKGGGVERIAVAIARLGPSYVSSDNSWRPGRMSSGRRSPCDSRRCRTAWRRSRASGRVAAVEAAFGVPLDCVFTEFRRAGRRGLDRPGAPRARSTTDKASARSQSKSSGRASSGASAATFPTCISPRGSPRRYFAEAPPPEAGRSRRHARPLGADGDGFPARSGGGLRIRREDGGGYRLPCAARRLGPHRARSPHPRMDRGHPAVRHSPS